MGSGLLKWILSKIKANANKDKNKSQSVDKAEEQKKED